MNRQLTGYRRWLMAFVIVTLPTLALVGTTAHAAGAPAGCTAIGHSITTGASCTYKSTTTLIEVVGAGDFWFVYSSSPLYGTIPCSADSLGAESIVCFSGGSKASPSTVHAFAALGVVTVRDLPA